MSEPINDCDDNDLAAYIAEETDERAYRHHLEWLWRTGQLEAQEDWV